MKTIIFAFLVVIGLNSHAAVEGSSISNAHIVTATSQSVVIRGRAPKNAKEMQELVKIGVTDFLIFKNDTKGEVAKEQEQLMKLGVNPSAITNIPFLWKDIHDFRPACEMTIQALQVLEEAVNNGRNIYFHCTVGEDRTGYLAGLWGIWTNTFQDERQALQQEMCPRGYEAGNPGKPYRDVVFKIRETLTPTYVKMAAIIAEAKQMGRNLDTSLCDQEPNVQVIPSAHYCASGK
jgi:hypothetical protein